MGCPDYPEALATYDEAVRLARRWLTGCREDAQDVVQDVYLTLYSARPPQVTRSYVLTRVRWRCFDALRREGRWQTRPLDPRLPAPGDLAGDVTERQVALARLVRVAGDREGRLLVASGAGYSDPEVARGLRLTVRAVRLRRHRARQRLAAAS